MQQTDFPMDDPLGPEKSSQLWEMNIVPKFAVFICDVVFGCSCCPNFSAHKELVFVIV